jgi:hypothetical protein
VGSGASAATQDDWNLVSAIDGLKRAPDPIAPSTTARGDGECLCAGPGRSEHRHLRGLLAVHSRCHQFVTCISRRLQPFRYLHSCSGNFRLEHSPGGPFRHWKTPPFHGAHPELSVAATNPGMKPVCLALRHQAPARAVLSKPHRSAPPVNSEVPFGKIPRCVLSQMWKAAQAFSAPSTEVRLYAWTARMRRSSTDIYNRHRPNALRTGATKAVVREGQQWVESTRWPPTVCRGATGGQERKVRASKWLPPNCHSNIVVPAFRRTVAAARLGRANHLRPKSSYFCVTPPLTRSLLPGVISLSRRSARNQTKEI